MVSLAGKVVMGSVVMLREAGGRHGDRVPRVRASVPAMQAEVLEAIASGQRLASVADLLCRWIERLAPRTLCSIMVVDGDGLLQPLAGPSLPATFSDAARGLRIAPEVGTCGRAAHFGVPVQTIDIGRDPCWEGLRTIPIKLGLRACWSSPIRGQTGGVIGTFALYFRSHRGPNRAEAHIVSESVRLAALAIEHEATLERLEQANQRLAAALGNVRQGVCFFDGRQRLVMANDQYAEIYGIEPGLMHPGLSLQEVVELRMAAGSGPLLTRDEYLDWRDRVENPDENSDTVVRLTNGRIIAMHHRPMPDGGWVSTHEDITEREQAQARIVHLATHDPLTGLANRTLFRERLEHALATRPPRQISAVIYLDLDRFKAVNDTFGHLVGDQLLIAASRRLQSCVREGDTITRLGGDEFAVLLPRIDRRTRAGELAARIAETITRPYDISGYRLSISTSLGIAAAPTDGGTADDLLRRADIALYRAKSERRGTWRLFEPAMEVEALSDRGPG